MNREHFLIELKIYLRPLSPQKQNYIIENYEEKFDEGIENGLTEEQIAKSLGKPQDIAANILKELGIDTEQDHMEENGWSEFGRSSYHHPYEARKGAPSQRHDSFFVRICQVVGILALNFFGMLWLILGGLAVLLALWLVALVCLFAPILGAFAFFNAPFSYGMFQLFASVALCGVGIIGLCLLFCITVLVIKVLIIYVKWCFKILAGRSMA